MKLKNFSQVFISGILVWLMLASVPAAIAGKTRDVVSHLPAQTTYSVTLSAFQTTVGGSITVNWIAPTGHSGSDYLRLAHINGSDSTYSWTQTLGSATTGSFTVTVPNIVDRYEFRLYRGSDYVRMAQSQSFAANQPNFNVSTTQTIISAGGQLTINWNVPAGAAVSDRLVIAGINQPFSQFFSQQSTNGINPGNAFATAPSQPGQYEIRYFKVGAPWPPEPPSAISQAFAVVAAAGGFAGLITQASNGSPVSGALIEARQSGVTKASFITDPSGSYNLPVALAGTYDLRVTAGGFPVVTRTGLGVTSGNTTVADFALSTNASLTGRVTRSGTGTSIAGAGLQLKQGMNVVATGSSNSSGNYTFTQIPPGTYSLLITAPGFQPKTQSSITLTAGNTSTVNVSLVETAPGAGSGTEFLYDDAGRLVATKDQGLITGIYNYDPSGNLISITAPSATNPAIISFSPTGGLPGTQVIIRGVNFAAVAAQNTVKFNGLSATVASATASEIVTSVPAGATTGPLSVTTAGGTTASGSIFTVGSVSSPNAPTITNFSPAVGHSGDNVTITGTNFDLEPSNNSVSIGRNFSPVSAATATSLTAQAGTSSGKISVTTPNGTAVSTADFFLVPATVAASQVSYAKRTWLGNRIGVQIPTLDKRGVLTFDGVAGRHFSVQLFTLQNNVRIDIFRPDGVQISSNTFAASTDPNATWFIDTQDLPLTGTYTLVMTPSGSDILPTTFYAQIYDVAHIYGQIQPFGTQQGQITTPGQNAYFSYHAEAGQKVLVQIDNSTHVGTAGVSSQANVFHMITQVGYQATPGVPIGGASYFVAFTPDGTTIPETGDYWVTINPTGAATGSVRATLYFTAPDLVNSINIGDHFGLKLSPPPPPAPPGSTTISVCPATACLGQNAWYKFQGTAGQKISLWRRDQPVTNFSSMGLVNVSFNLPTGYYLVPSTQTSDGYFFDAITLPVTGEYKIFVDPAGGNIGTADFDLYGIPNNIVATATINGPPVTVNTAVPGHNPSVSFIATAGQQARINVSNATVPDGTSVALKSPDGTYLGGAVTSGGTSFISSTNLSTTGTYVVEVNPSGAALGAATIAVGGDVYQNLPANGIGTAIITNPGQSSWFTFNGAAGQRVSLALSNVTMGSGTASFRTANGTLLGSLAYFNTNGGFVDTVTLPATAQYKIVIDPDSTYTGSATLTLYNVPPDAAGTINIGGDPLTRSTSVPGQNIALLFNATANQRIDVYLSEAWIPNKSFYLKNPDGSQLTGAGTFGNTAFISNILLPQSGAYTLVIDPAGTDIGSVTMQLGGVVVGSASRLGLNHSVSVRVGSGTTSELMEISNSLSVRFGNIQVFSPGPSVSVRFGNTQVFSPGASVSVTTGPLITVTSPAQIAKGATLTLTLTGNNFTGATTLRFLNNGILDNALTVTNLSVNSSGTSLTATITVAAGAATGARSILVVLPDVSSSGAASTANTINVIP